MKHINKYESITEAKDNLYLQMHKKYAVQIKMLKAKKIKKLTDLVSVQRWAMEDRDDYFNMNPKKKKELLAEYTEERKLFKKYMARDYSVMLPKGTEALPESVNEAEKYNTDKFKIGDKIKTNIGVWEVIETDYKPGKSFKAPFIFKGKDMKKLNIPNPPPTNKNAVGYKVTDGDRYPIIGFLYQYKDITKLATTGVDESVNEGFLADLPVWVWSLGYAAPFLWMTWEILVSGFESSKTRRKLSPSGWAELIKLFLKKTKTKEIINNLSKDLEIKNMMDAVKGGKEKEWKLKNLLSKKMSAKQKDIVKQEYDHVIHYDDVAKRLLNNESVNEGMMDKLEKFIYKANALVFPKMTAGKFHLLFMKHKLDIRKPEVKAYVEETLPTQKVKDEFYALMKGHANESLNEFGPMAGSNNRSWKTSDLVDRIGDLEDKLFNGNVRRAEKEWEMVSGQYLSGEEGSEYWADLDDDEVRSAIDAAEAIMKKYKMSESVNEMKYIKTLK